MHCKNCSNPVENNFCSYCGQSVKVERLKTKNLTQDLIHEVFQLNHGIVFTFLMLFKKPGYYITSYLEGKRKALFKPISYVFMLSTLYYLVSYYSGGHTYINDFILGFKNAGESNDEVSNEFLSWFAEHFAYTSLMLIPLQAVATLIAFRKSGFNFMEHIVINAYITGQQAIIYALFVALGSIFNVEYLLSAISSLFAVCYAFYVFISMFKAKNKASTIGLGIFYYLLYFVFITLMLFLVLLIEKVIHM
tara:strand:- start:242 stop:988 length:747 start_codon:yes stop_codon:yes gene_type:complete